MKGDSTTHTTNKKYREAYDKIDWKKTRDSESVADNHQR